MEVETLYATLVDCMALQAEMVAKQESSMNVPIWPVPTKGSQLRVALVDCKLLMRSPTTVCGAAGKVLMTCEVMLGETP